MGGTDTLHQDSYQSVNIDLFGTYWMLGKEQRQSIQNSVPAYILVHTLARETWFNLTDASEHFFIHATIILFWGVDGETNPMVLKAYLSLYA